MFDYKLTKNYQKDSGFTLVELSIVIVIIGLIVAGIVGGQTLVRQAKLKNVISDLQKYQVAINAFRLEYDAIPGDFSQASAFWGTWNAGAATGAMNGNGDRIVAQNSEDPDVWHHLNKAELIPFDNSSQLQSYINGSYERTDRNIVRGPFDHTWYRYVGNLDFTNWQRFYAIKQGMNGLFYTSHPLTNPTGGSIQYMSLAGKYVFAIDTKLDDGIANKGVIMGSGGARKEDAVNISHANSCSLHSNGLSPSSPLNYQNLDTEDINCLLGYFF